MAELNIWTIYRSPADAPGSYVTRRWIITGGEPQAREGYLEATLEAARRRVPAGLIPMGPSDEDNACVVESWL